MSVRTNTDPGRALWCRVMTAAMIAALGVAVMLPAPHAAAATTKGRQATAYVANGSSVLPVDTARDTAGTPIPVPGADGVIPAPNGRIVYVTGTGGLTPIVTATGTTRPMIPPSGPVAIAPDSRTLYVGSGTSVAPVDAVTDTLGTPIPVGGTPLDSDHTQWEDRVRRDQFLSGGAGHPRHRHPGPRFPCPGR
jgi:hypothetical protein